MKKKIMILGGALAMSLSVLLAGCSTSGKSESDVLKGNAAVGVSVHDPSILKADGEYYIFGSHMAAAKSTNLVDWEIFAEGVNGGNKLFDNLFDKDMAAFDFVGRFTDGKYAVWAPDVIFNEKMGKWIMYFCTSHDYMTSNLCMATADEPQGPYTYRKTLLYSGFTTATADKTNFYEIMGEDANIRDYMASGKYNNLSYPNCIDPAIFTDKDGNMHLVYGSWSGGIWMFDVDDATGELIHPETDKDAHIDKYFGRYLIGGLHNSCEGPYIFFDEETGYYYLTVSYGELTREGGYQIRVFRADNVYGPYTDAAGETLGYAHDHSEYGVKMMGNYMLPSLKTAYMAPGHNSILTDDDGRMYIIYHQRFDSGTEFHEPRVHEMLMTENGWPAVMPFNTTGNDLQKKTEYNVNDIAGRWYFLNHGTDISADIHIAKECTIDNGKISGEEISGSVELTESSRYIRIVTENAEYCGVVADMTDEAGNLTRCISAVGDNNETLWGIMYLE